MSKLSKPEESTISFIKVECIDLFNDIKNNFSISKNSDVPNEFIIDMNSINEDEDQLEIANEIFGEELENLPLGLIMFYL